MWPVVGGRGRRGGGFWDLAGFGSCWTRLPLLLFECYCIQNWEHVPMPCLEVGSSQFECCQKTGICHPLWADSRGLQNQQGLETMSPVSFLLLALSFRANPIASV